MMWGGEMGVSRMISADGYLFLIFLFECAVGLFYELYTPGRPSLSYLYLWDGTLLFCFCTHAPIYPLFFSSSASDWTELGR